MNDSDEAEPSSSKRRKSSEIQSPLLPKNECLFCESSRKRTHGREEKLIKCVTKNADQSIRAASQRKQDHRLLGKKLNGDLVAREAHYHTSCRKNYTRTDDNHERCDKDERVVEELNAHQNAFDYISSYIEENLINGCTVECMTMLKERYLLFMYESSPSVYNPLYKTSNVKIKVDEKIWKSWLRANWSTDLKSHMVRQLRLYWAIPLIIHTPPYGRHWNSMKNILFHRLEIQEKSLSSMI